MSRNLNSILSKPDAARLRAAYGCPPEAYSQLIEMLNSDLIAYRKFGILSLPISLALTSAQFASVGTTEIKGFLNDFLVITVTQKLLTAVEKGIKIIVNDPSHLDGPRFTAFEDPYLSPFDELGDIAENVPQYENEPEYVHWGEDVFLMTEERLTEELKTGDPLRLLHRTPYRPIV